MRVRDNNNEDKEKLLINTLIHYLIQNQSLPRRSTSLRINQTIYEKFFWTCRKLGLLKRGHINVALEGLMQFFVDTYKDTPEVVQTTLLPSKLHKREIEWNVAKKLELKMVKTDLANIIESCEQKRGHETWRQSRLKEILEKAIHIYDETRDQDLGALLSKSEKFV